MNKELTPLEALEIIKKYNKVVANSEELGIIETALKEYTGFQFVFKLSNRNEGKEVYYKLKALEIIREKEVNVEIFKSLLRTGYTYEQFEMVCLDEDGWNDYPPYKHHMTIEEFVLVKEVML